MAKTTFAVRIDSKLAELIRSFCNSHGIKQNFFVEKALQDRIEEEELKEDLLDFKKQRADEKKAISFEEYLHLRKSVSA
ncbi:MAG: hypothetical protein HYT97_06625 [Elusimicrobia bacterium]|nr:hypothetical protein [Elusimicrobiota bacterium]OGR50924.1 MAG: hypothetical protein A2034_03995 [Elusimicrobia bacterium GWA2_38_7]OGR79722.1 MAG: hypothetical protein A3B80_00940 [Elusimicrobia bacterium RIFCSPHIGHO2_02_FULL_39_36]OGR92081.1 MAG: hypothetical protein A3I11_07760 [Elusimicrobia bacterium RIFCSPLOWO2_02_FULL_39_32]OGR98629.1 MAG: hypothetical protein A3G85_04670 [Elusimicrobia bacterium RIFCSPLOWO2_12_FULL_39_28]